MIGFVLDNVFDSIVEFFILKINEDGVPTKRAITVCVPLVCFWNRKEMVKIS